MVSDGANFCWTFNLGYPPLSRVASHAGAIARGVAEGLARKGPLDINAASATELQTLPGVTPELAGKIVEHRPYSSTRDVVRRGIVSSAQCGVRPGEGPRFL